MSKYTIPDFAPVALITIDMQQDTLDGQSLEVPGASAILPTLRRLVESFREAGEADYPYGENLSAGWIKCGFVPQRIG